MRDFVADWDALKTADPEVASAIANELERERTTLRLIAGFERPDEGRGAPPRAESPALPFNLGHPTWCIYKDAMGLCQVRDSVPRVLHWLGRCELLSIIVVM